MVGTLAFSNNVFWIQDIHDEIFTSFAVNFYFIYLRQMKENVYVSIVSNKENIATCQKQLASILLMFLW